MSELLSRVGALLARATEVYRHDPRAAGWLGRHTAALAGPLRIAVVGPPGAGASTLISALVGEAVAPLPDCPMWTTWYVAGSTPSATAHLADSPPRRLPAERRVGRPWLDLSGLTGGPVEKLTLEWPVRGLRGMALIDLAPDVAADPRRAAAEADAVIHLTAGPTAADPRTLRALGDSPIAATGLSTVVALGRADEAGGGRIDALTVAKQLARQHRRDPRMWTLCQDVVAVSGLLGLAGRTLSEDEVAALGAIALAPRAELDVHLLSADRFTAADFPLQQPVRLRRLLLDRLGLFGLRLCTTLIRQGFTSHAALCAQLVARSGLVELRDAITRSLTDRADVLRARTALHALHALLRNEPADPGLAAELDRVVAGAHEFTELRLLAALHTGQVELPDEITEEAHRLLGGAGSTTAERLGLPDDTDPAELRAVAAGQLRRWQWFAADDEWTNSSRRAADVVVRSCSTLLAADVRW